MQNQNCNYYLSSIAISIVISLILTLLFYNNLISGITYSLIFSIVLSIVSFLILTIFGSSDNGLTRRILCQNTLFVIISSLGNVFFALLAILVTLSPFSILSAILVGLSFFFLALNILSLSILLISILVYENFY